MPTVIIGDGPLLTTLRQHLPERAWRVPAGDTPAQQARFLTEHPATGRRMDVLTDAPADWTGPSRAGWNVWWCATGQVPLGATPLTDDMLAAPVCDLAARFWNDTSMADRRTVADLMRGDTTRPGIVLPVTSVTGGVGKTLTARRLAERAAQMRVRTLLVDGNMRQSSQRSFFDPSRTMRVTTIMDWRGGDPRKGANPGRTLHTPYDVAFAPPLGMTVTWGHYQSFIDTARRMWGLVIVDLDRISMADLNTPDTAASSIVARYARAGQPVLFIVKAGRQTQADAMGLLSHLPGMGLPRECVGVKDTLPIGMDDYTPCDYSQVATFLGMERQTRAAEARIDKGENGWDDPELDLARERTLAWAVPDGGFDPARYEHRRKRKGWFR